MVDGIENRIYELVRPYAGVYVFKRKEVELTPDTDFDTDLSMDVSEAEDMMDEFFKSFDVDRGNFNINTYYPDTPFSWNPFKKIEPIPVPDFTIRMLIESAKAGKWLYD
ncbi:DUF1493 family protein [Enterobacteriaceae bacterium BIT-l23]|uniref:DUF1493 family protein n=1 Tax=Jejubacter calystegiae TaxID=2579935 RepID=A0A4V1G7R8_9ENTR|nr:DUF1493 family protein [Jejubacter calystegiae]NUU65107.1 DUF1493 family protein [Enterobacteriaceae bacterium BIT-l23]QCT20597.1 DUF1493 family protein [Jejubacter calystegiae]